jgi:hypothetical protein
VASLDELKLRIVAAIETVTPQMLENTWSESKYRLDTLCAKNVCMLKLFTILQY